MRGLVAEVESELAIVDELAGFEIEAGVFQAHGAMAQPVMLGHGLDERFFGGCCGLVLLLELGQEFEEVVLRFRWQHPEFARRGETVTEVVARGGGFPGFRFGAGGELRIGLIGGDLRWCRHTAQVSREGVRREGLGRPKLLKVREIFCSELL